METFGSYKKGFVTDICIRNVDLSRFPEEAVLEKLLMEIKKETTLLDKAWFVRQLEK